MAANVSGAETRNGPVREEKKEVKKREGKEEWNGEKNRFWNNNTKGRENRWMDGREEGMNVRKVSEGGRGTEELDCMDGRKR